MPRKPLPKCTYEEYLEIKKENKRKLDEIFAMDNYQEVLGKKYYGDNWMATLYGNHPERVKRTKENVKRARLRSLGYDIPYAVKNKNRKCIQIDDEGNIIKKWDSIEEAANSKMFNLKDGVSQIIRVCRGEHERAGGFKWKWDE